MVSRSQDAAVYGLGARQALGQFGERIAAQHLVDAGLVVLARNWRCRAGEVDIVALDGTVLVICEVKTRRSVDFGTPLDAVTPMKAARLRRLAAHWLADPSTADLGGVNAIARYSEIRFDIVSVLRPQSGPTSIEHLRGAF